MQSDNQQTWGSIGSNGDPVDYFRYTTHEDLLKVKADISLSKQSVGTLLNMSGVYGATGHVEVSSGGAFKGKTVGMEIRLGMDAVKDQVGKGIGDQYYNTYMAMQTEYAATGYADGTLSEKMRYLAAGVDAFSEIFEADGVNANAATVAEHMRDVIGEWSVQGSAYVADINACFNTLLGALEDWDKPRYFAITGNIEKEVKSLLDAKVIWNADGGNIGQLIVKGYGSTTTAHTDIPDTVTKRAIDYQAHIMVQTEKNTRAVAEANMLDDFQFSSGDGRVRVDAATLISPIDVSNWIGIDDFRAVKSHAHDRGGHVIVQLNDDVLVINDIHKADLHASDFTF